MKLLKLFSSFAPNKVFLAILAGAISGIAYALLIPVMMTALTVVPNGLSASSEQAYQVLGIEVAHPKFAAMFLILCIVILVTRSFSQVFLATVAMDVTKRLRKSLYERISNTSISDLERCSNGRLIQSMTNDVYQIVSGAGLIPDLLIQISTLLGLMGFLYYVSAKVFIFVLCTIVFGGITFQLMMLVAVKYFRRSREHMDLLQEGFKGLVEGAKELKLNQSKRRHFMTDQLLQQENYVMRSNKMGFYIMQVARNYGDMITFFAMGIVGFVYVNYHVISSVELAGVLMVLLYISGPVAAILNILPELARARVSLVKIESLFDDLPCETASLELQTVPEWDSIRLKSVCYQYPNSGSGSHVFSVGPVDALIKKGEITFIVGGNGSGKSTLAKVISLHYHASSGEMLFGDTPLGDENINSYRQKMACIYSDYYLFKQLYSDFSKEKKLQAQVNYYLEVLELKGKVEFHEGSFSTLNLSDGQRRRLALLVAFLDDKDLYIFDEWAADQDPEFKQIFYFDILPKIKAQGKAVVVISHDDRYFDVADQLLTMESGKLVGS
ncbi:MAG: cyclic peptide transporter [Alteromonadaceae bacterium]|nr:MAG: cyclic peptide transporter [Alteromonadaceae bacterium]